MKYTNYSGSKCPKCESSSFEVVEETPKGSNFKVMFFRCSHCKTVITVMDFFNIGFWVRKIAERLNIS